MQPATLQMLSYDEDDTFSREVSELVAYGETMEWLHKEDILWVGSQAHEMMDDEVLTLPMDPAVEFRPIMQAEAAALYTEEDEDNDTLSCNENAVDINNYFFKERFQDEIHAKIVEMDTLRAHGKLVEAQVVCRWVLDQNNKYGVTYKPSLLQILKQTMAKLEREVSVFSSGWEYLSVALK
jgi:hypothetical protein